MSTKGIAITLPAASESRTVGRMTQPPDDLTPPDADTPDHDTLPAWPTPTQRPPMSFTDAAFPTWPDTDDDQELFV